MATKGFYVVDYVVFSVILLISLAVGIYYSLTGQRQRTMGEYFLADKKLHPVPVAMSMFMSYVSGVMVLGNTAEMYTAGAQFWLACWGSTLAFIFSTIVLVPFFYSLTLVSSYEIVYIGLAMYTPAVALNAVTGFPVWGSILACGLVAAIYTSMGGIKAVVWTDTIQGFILFAGVITVYVIGGVLIRRLHCSFNPDPTVRLTFWSAIFGRFFISLNYVGTGQTSIQRYSTLPSLRDAQLSALLNIPCIIIVYTITCLCGLTVYAYYAALQCDPLANGDISSSNQLLPYFIVDAVDIPGISGLFVAVLFSGALSSISSSLNSMAACTWKDFLENRLNSLLEWKKAAVNKVLVAVYGGTGIGMAFIAQGFGGHVLQASQALVGGMGGPSIGMFFLGMFFPCANWQGALFGSLIGFALVTWMSVGSYLNPGSFGSLPTSTANCSHDVTSTITYSTLGVTEPTTQSYDDEGISYMYTAAIGCIVTLICGLIISAATGAENPKKADPRLINPIFDRLCCCLPTRWLQACWCGVPFDKPGGEEEEVTNAQPEEKTVITTQVKQGHREIADDIKNITLQSYTLLTDLSLQCNSMQSYNNKGFSADL